MRSFPVDGEVSSNASSNRFLDSIQFFLLTSTYLINYNVLNLINAKDEILNYYSNT